MKKATLILSIIFASLLACLLLCFSICSIYSCVNSHPNNDGGAQPDDQTVDAACKDYYSICEAGKAPGEGTTRKEIQEFIEAASIKDALDYCNIYEKIDLSKLCVDTNCRIYDPKSNAKREENPEKTDILHNRNDEPGSLKALYS